MGSVEREQLGFASIRALEVASQNSTRPERKGEGGIPSTEVLLLDAVNERGRSRVGRPKTSHIRLMRRIGSTIVLLLRMLIMLPEG